MQWKAIRGLRHFISVDIEINTEKFLKLSFSSILNLIGKQQMRKFDSIADMAQYFGNQVKSNTQKYGSLVATNATNISSFLSTSQGRDKFCALMQYHARLYYICMTNSEEYKESINNDQFKSVAAARTLEKQLSKSRKIFRFMKFLDDLRKIRFLLQKIRDKSASLSSYLSLFETVCSFFYHLLDNMVWLTQIGFASPFFLKSIKWKSTKDGFSLMRLFFDIAICGLDVYAGYKKEAKNFSKLKKLPNQVVVFDSDAYHCVRNLIIQRRKRRYQELQIFLSVLRVFMLVSSLKLKFHQHLDPIFIALCGTISSIIAIFKLASKKKFYKFKQGGDIKGAVQVAQYATEGAIPVENADGLQRLGTLFEFKSGRNLEKCKGGMQDQAGALNFHGSYQNLVGMVDEDFRSINEKGMLDPEATAAVIEKTESFMNHTTQGEGSDDSDDASNYKNNRSIGDLRGLHKGRSYQMDADISPINFRSDKFSRSQPRIASHCSKTSTALIDTPYDRHALKEGHMLYTLKDEGIERMLALFSMETSM